MRKLSLFAAGVFVCCLAPLGSRAQTTLVTATVTDPNGVPYAGATLKAQLTVPGATVTISNAAQCASAGQGSAPCKIPIQGTAGPVTLDSGGNIPGGGLVMFDNTFVNPGGTQWIFTVSIAPGVALPFGTGPQTFSVTLSISGANQSITSSLNGVAPALSNFASSPGSTFPGMSTINVARKCGGIPNCTVIVGDMNFDVDATFTAASPTVTTSGAAPAFVAASVPNQVAFGTFNCQAASEASCTNNCPQSTMTYVSAHVVTLSNNCTNSSSAAAHSNIFIWCTDDGAALSTAFNLMFPSGGNSAQTQELDLPAGGMCMGNNPFVAPTINPRQNPIIIRGHNTEIVPLQNMPCNQGSNKGCLLYTGFQNNTLGNIGSSDAVYDITFWGGGTSDKGASATYSNPAYGIFGSYGTNYYNVWVVGWVWNRASATPAYGWRLSGSNTYGSGDYAGGNFGVACSGFVGAPTALFGGNWGSGQFNNLVVTGTGTDGGCSTFGVYMDQPRCGGGCATNSTTYPVLVNSGTYRDFGSEAAAVWSAGGDTWLSGSQLNAFNTWDCVHVAAGFMSLQNTQCSNHMEQSGGTLIWAGGNHADGTTAPFVDPQFATMTGGSQIAFQSVSGACTGTVPASATSGGLYGTGSNITSTVCATIGGTTVGAGTVMQQAGTMGTFQVAAGTGGVNASSGVFTVLKNGGATTITCTVGTGTSCVDVTHYVAYAAGDLISIQYTSQAADTLANVKASVMTAF